MKASGTVVVEERRRRGERGALPCREEFCSGASPHQVIGWMCEGLLCLIPTDIDNNSRQQQDIISEDRHTATIINNKCTKEIISY
jgi:hypothetical protein